MTQFYILSYNPFSDKIQTSQLVTIVRDSRKIIEWHMPFAGTIFLKSNETLSSLVESFSSIFAGSEYVISPAQPHQMNGALNVHVWYWMREQRDILAALKSFGEIPPPPAP